jgi:signal transduction histidine kinase
VLELSKAESSSFALIETPCSLHDVVADVVSTFEAVAREKGRRVKFTTQGSVELTVGTKEMGPVRSQLSDKLTPATAAAGRLMC